MANNDNSTREQEMKSNSKSLSKKDFNILKITIILLIVIIGVLSFLYIDTYQSYKSADKSLKHTVEDKNMKIERNIRLKSELDSLMHKHNIHLYQHDSILHDKDSIIQKNADEIKRLIASKADHRRIRRRLDRLRVIAKDYVLKIDSLHVLADDLRTERDEVKDELSEVKDRTVELEKDRKELSSKVNIASALRAYQISAKGYHTGWLSDRESENDRADRVEYVRVCFTIGENPIAHSGNYNVYVRIAKPDEEILKISDDEAHSFTHNEDTLQFTMKKQINYQNREKELCLTWDRTGNYMEGVYLVSIFTDEHRIGESSFILR